MQEFLRSMTWPFLACLVLTGIHVYLGIHVLARKVIFVDLALAQIAALGAVWGALLGWGLSEDPWAIKAFSLAFTFIGAAVFALTRRKHERVPHEAIIGIAYAVALAATILASAHLAHGAEEVSELLAGSILWVRPPTIVFTALLYAAIGAFHFVFRRRFFAISQDHERALAEGVNVRLWDFLFYVSFGFVVTSSVSIAGVLLVFSYLVIPSVVALMYAERTRARLAAGWAVGTLVSLIGVSVSYARDLPSGPTIVVCFGLFLVGAGLLRYWIDAPGKIRASLEIVAGVVFMAALLGGSFLLRKQERHDFAAELRSPLKNRRLTAMAQVEVDESLWTRARPLMPGLARDLEAEVRSKAADLIGHYRAAELLELAQSMLADRNELVREAAIRCVRALDDRSSSAALLAQAGREEDEYIKVELAEAALELGEPGGIPVLIDVMDEGEAEQARRDAYEHLSAHTVLDFPFCEEQKPARNDEEVRLFRDWWKVNGPQLVLQPDTGRFVVLR